MILFDQISFFLPLMASLIFSFLLVGLVNLKEDQHKVLISFFILLSINRIIAFFALVQEFTTFRIWIEPIAYLLILAIIPFYFLYLKSLIKGKINKTDFYHFIPAIALFFYGLIPYLFIPFDEKIQYIVNYNSDFISNNIIRIIFSNLSATVMFAYNIQLLVYFSLILWLIVRFLQQKTLKNLVKNEKIVFKRIIIYIVAILIVESYGVVINLLNVNDPVIISNFIIFFLIIILGYFGLKQEFFIEKEVKKGSIEIPEGIIDKLYDNIKTLFDQKEIYLNPKLTLQDLVNELNSNKTYVSVVIREKFKENFISLLTKYRVEKAKVLLLDKDYSNYSLEGIGKMSGFNLKSTFYTVFKKETGFTPSNYVKHINSEQETE